VLHVIRRARTLGLALSETWNILEPQDGATQPCGQVVGLLDAHLAEIDRTMAELRRLESSLLSARHL
jgi:DNA-binding transcriptional MerR regulator